MTLNQILFSITVIGCLICTVAANHIEGRLIRDMLENYTKEARPVIDPHSVLNISMTFSLSKIESLDEKNQVFNTFGWIQIWWMDEFLRWDPADYGGISKMVLRADEIWLPEIALKNSIDSGADLSYKTPFRVSVFYFGITSWIPAVRLSTVCNVNLRYFPFDSHECEIVIVNWMYSAVMVDFVVVGDLILFTKKNQGEWDITETSTFKHYIEAEGIRIPHAGFKVKVKRLPTYFLCNVIVPCILMSVMSMMSYLLPCESGEKVSLSITVLLSYSVILLMVSELTPRTASSIPLVTIYILSSMSLTGVSLLANIYVLNLHHHSGRNTPPKWLRFILLRCIARIVCVNTTRVKSLTTGSVSPTGWLNLFNSRTKLLTKKRDNSGVTSQSDVQVEEIEQPKTSSVLSSDHVRLPEEAMALIKKYLEKEKDLSAQEQNRYEWQLMSKVLDRLFFFLSLLYVTFDAMVYFIRCLD